MCECVQYKDTHTHARVLSAEKKRNQTKRPTTIASIGKKTATTTTFHTHIDAIKRKKSYEI